MRSDRSHESSRLSKAIATILLAVPMISVLAYGAVDSWSIGLISILVAVITLLWIADAWISGEFRYSTSLLQLPVLGVIVIGVIQLLPFGDAGTAAEILNAAPSATISIDPFATRLFVIRAVITFIFFAVALAYIPSGGRPKTTAVVIVIFGALIAFFAILQRLAIPEAIYGLRPTPQAIPFGTYINQHHFAALMEMTSGVALGLLFGTGLGRERKLLLGIAAGIMGMAIIFTGSRGGLISYLGVVAFAAVASLARRTGGRADEADTRLRRNRNLLVVTAAGGLVIVVLGSVLFLGGEASLLRGIGLSESAADPSSGRMHFWNIAWQIFLAHPILGTGLDTFGVAFSRYDTWNGLYRVEQAHNDYLQMLADAGVFGFACVAAFVIVFLKTGVSAIGRRTSDIRRSIAIGAMAGCFGILIHSFFDFPLRTPANAFFFLLLVVLVAGRESDRRSGNGN